MAITIQLSEYERLVILAQLEAVTEQLADDPQHATINQVIAKLVGNPALPSKPPNPLSTAARFQAPRSA